MIGFSIRFEAFCFILFVLPIPAFRILLDDSVPSNISCLEKHYATDNPI